MTATKTTKIYRKFRVFRRSNNLNSFGLRGLWVMDRDGNCWEVAANHLNDKQLGEYYTLEIDGRGSPTFANLELPRQKPKAPTEVADIIWGDMKNWQHP